MTSLVQNSMIFNPKILINFDGGNLSSDAGLLLYKEFDEIIGFSKVINEHLDIKDSRKSVIHTNQAMVQQKIYQILAGYETDDTADSLRFDPLFTEILGKKALASQPSLSRLNSRLDEDSLLSFETLHGKLLDNIYAIQKPEHVLLDLDSTNLQTHGKQEGAKFNYHYSMNGYHPLMMFDGLTGDLLKAELRDGNVYTSKDVEHFILPTLQRFELAHPDINLFVRADSGFAKPELFDVLEEMNVPYSIRLKANANLYKHVKDAESILQEQAQQDMCSYQVIYDEFLYQAKSWKSPRRVVAIIEKPSDQLTFNHMFVVTSMKLHSEEIIRFYRNRGTMENFIKEGKNGFIFEEMGSSSFTVNANKLQIAMLAYNFNNWLRRLCFNKQNRHLRMESIRSKLIKVAAKIVHHSRKVSIKLPTSYPYKELFMSILSNIQTLRLRI